MGTIFMLFRSTLVGGNRMLHRVLTGPGLTLAAVSLLSAQDVPTPESHFGYEIGSEQNLANWTELTAYYEVLAKRASE